jgi:hypothetical protein
MSFIRKALMLIIATGLFAGSYYILTKNPCDSPITYRLGTFDTKFGISKADFLADAAAAEKIWESSFGKQFFVYDPNGSLPINLMYDTRQATADKNKVLAANVDQTQATADSVKARFESLKAEYTAAGVAYQSLVDSFTTQLASYNADANYWNTRGGAPKSEYEALNQKKAALQALQTQVETKRVEVNDLARQVNAGVTNYNSLVKIANSDIRVINQSADKEFEQGEYVSDSHGKRIDVYEFDGKSKLVRLLAHEMGHALGLDHNNNPDSIMYYLNKSLSMKLSPEDTAAVKKICKISSSN